jgi:O-antigen/teichoic acid export membrane protein
VTGTFVIVGLGRLLQILINILILRVMTHYLSEKEIGSFFLIMSVITYFTLTIINPVGQYVNRKIHSWYENNNLLGHFILFHLFCLASALLSLFIVFILKYYFNIVEA